MFNIRAKYNNANIMLPDESHIDETTKKQIYGFLNHPAFGNSYISIMPDCHAGAGSCIGFTMQMNDYIIPNIVGVDIGCGVCSVNIGKANIELGYLDNFIRANIPSGFSVNDRSDMKAKDLEYRVPGIFQFKKSIMEISERIQSDANRNWCAVGSLGGGNHFIEVGIDENEDKWLTIHTGSRKFGLDIANYHQNKAKKLMKEMFIGSAYRDLEFMPIDKGGSDYILDMSVAQTFAKYNRMAIITKIMKYLNVTPVKYAHSIHNFIDLEDKIIRKGAIRAYENESLVIPFNMEDGLIIGTGKSNPKWNHSAPHGAGRVLSRTKAKESLNLEDAKTSMANAGIYTTSLSENSLDEAKGAYKDKQLIIDSISETVDITNFVKPIYNFKAD
jgi:RNA-splicing ligase RtcB